MNKIMQIENLIYEIKGKHVMLDSDLARVFTEQGVAMLATILKSDVATKVSIDIMDAYADNTLLDIIKRLNINVTIITKCNNLKVIYDNTFHDRYFILDNSTC